MMTLRLPSIPLWPAVFVAVALMLSAAMSFIATPQSVGVTNEPSLEDVVPKAFAGWREKPSTAIQVSLSTGDGTSMYQPYDQTVMRVYENEKGETVFLALAWGREQRQEVKIHRPDLCYVAQGFKVDKLVSHEFQPISATSQRQILGKHMLARHGSTFEAVSYWMRIGSLFSENAFETRMHIFEQGFKGEIPDGILVRASMRGRDRESAENAFPVLDEFLHELVEATPENARRMLLGNS